MLWFINYTCKMPCVYLYVYSYESLKYLDAGKIVNIEWLS